ncbi:IS3 family transposase [Domibacillus epiphyticus]
MNRKKESFHSLIRIKAKLKGMTPVEYRSHTLSLSTA